MSLTAIMNNALSGLQASQLGMRATSTNISNVNTPGYARQNVSLAARILNGQSSGVTVESIRRVTDSFLTTASLNAKASAAGSEALYEFMNRAQVLFGDPSSGASVFDDLNTLFAGFAEVAGDPSSSVRRAGLITDLSATFNEFGRLGDEIQRLRAEADARVSHAVGRVNDLLAQVVRLNGELQRGQIADDSTGAENALAQVTDELAELIDIRVLRPSSGSVEIRTADGLLLAGHQAATLTYDSLGAAHPGRDYSQILVQYGASPPQALEGHISAGEIRSLLDARDIDLPQLALEVGEFAAKTADALNAAHNQATAHPAPASLAGRNTGLLAADALNFTGETSVVITDAAGALVHRVDIDFDAGTYSVNGGGAVGFGATVGGLATALNTALGANGTAAFANGRLALTAAGGNGVAVVQSETDPSDRAGRGFSHVFGLNDLVTSSSPQMFDTGLTTADAHGFTAGEQISLRLTRPNGTIASERTVTIGGATLGDVLTALNDPTTGFGAHGAFALDASGELAFTPAAGKEGIRIGVLDDTTVRGGTGLSFTQMFGLGDQARAGRAAILSVRADLAANPQTLALGRIDLAGVALGDTLTGSGDGAGAYLLQAAGSAPTRFDAAGAFAATTSSVLDYAGRLAGDAGRRAAGAERTRDASLTLKTEADNRRASVEGVNIEEEMIALTNYQQSFNAASRLIQAAKEMTDVLLSVV